MGHASIPSRRRSVSVIINTFLGVALFCKVQIQPVVTSDSTDGEIRFMHKYVKKNNTIWSYMEALTLHTGSPTLHWEYITSFSSVVEAKIVLPRFK